MKTYDLIILGGGSGSALARRAGRAGMNTALVEPGPLGGTCPNRGCIPSKLLLEHATVAETIRRASKFHIRARIERIDTRKILHETRAAISETPGAIAKSLGKNVRHLAATGSFEGPHQVRVGDEVLTAKRIVIATGTRPTLPPSVDRATVPYLVSDDVFALSTAPASVILVGGGFISCEFAHFFAGVGTRVTVIDRGHELLAREDADVRRAFAAAFVPRIDLRAEANIAKVTYSRGRFRVKLTGKGAGSVTADTLVYAIGRVPNSDTLALDRAGVATDAHGFVRVNDYLETNVRGVFAIGDANGRGAFTHAASVQTEYLGERIVDAVPRARLGKVDDQPMPHAVFTDPEIGSVGETEEQLVARGAKYLKSVVRYEDVAKGQALKEEHGLAKLLADPRGRILGFHVVGPGASMLLHQVVPVMRWRNHVSSLTAPITVHPALSELVAATAWEVLDTLPKSARRGPR